MKKILSLSATALVVFTFGACTPNTDSEDQNERSSATTQNNMGQSGQINDPGATSSPTARMNDPQAMSQSGTAAESGQAASDAGSPGTEDSMETGSTDLNK